MRQLQSDVEAGIVGLVLAKDIARVSRSATDFHNFFDEMADVGVEVKFANGDFSLGEYFSANLKKGQDVYQQFLKTKKRSAG